MATARTPSTRPGPGGRLAFFALDRPGAGTVPVFERPGTARAPAFASQGEPGATALFHALAPDTAKPPPGTLPLLDAGGRPVGLVWRVPPGSDLAPPGPTAP